MVLERDKQKRVYTQILLNLWNGDYLTKARKGYLSEPGSREWFKRMVRDGYLLERKDKTNKKYAIFTKEGKKFLKELCPFWSEDNEGTEIKKNCKDNLKQEKFNLLKGGVFEY